jgi:para-nitrobenzyl esterase
VAATSAAGPSKLTIAQGELAGKRVGKTRVFLNIPYAEPPVGALRFAPAQPAANWSGMRQAVAYGPSCPQPPNPLVTPGPQDEDCLSLNVFAPTSGRRLPVIVYLPGGGFVTGGSNAYDGQHLSENANAIVITLNYRLGALGFLSHPALDQERRSQPSGNDAIGDQQLALQWVKANAASFGGDPTNVTLMGVSAGSVSTCVHMVSPPSRTLAQRFVMESGACTGGLPLRTPAQAQELGTEFANAFCTGAGDVLACLRNQPADQLVAWGADRGLTGAGWLPVVNPVDAILPAHPTQLIAAGNYNKGPLILGSNAREFGLFQAIGQAPVMTSVADLSGMLDQTFGPIAPLVALQYLLTATDATANDVFVQLMTDFLIRCPTRALARMTTAAGTRAYLYHFEEGLAYHVYELPYVLDTPNAMFGAPTLVEPLRSFVQDGIANFVHHGSPNTYAVRNAWPLYSAMSDRHTVLKAAPSVASGLAKANCDFWDQITLLSQLAM